MILSGSLVESQAAKKPAANDSSKTKNLASNSSENEPSANTNSADNSKAKTEEKTDEKTESGLPKLKPTACSKRGQLTMLNYNTELIRKGKTADRMIETPICERISKNTCCGNQTFAKLKTVWSALAYDKNSMFKKYFGAMESIMVYSYNDIAEYARNMKKIESLKNKYNSEKSDILKSVGNKKYSLSTFYETWVNKGTKCFDYMNNLTKGSMCAVCDDEEYLRFNSSKNDGDVQVQYISSTDAYSFAINCTDYVQATHELYKVINNFKYCVDMKVCDNLGIADDECRHTMGMVLDDDKDHEKVVKAMNKCRKDDTLKSCKENEDLVLRYFMIGPVTKIDYENFNSLTKLHFKIDYNFGDKINRANKEQVLKEYMIENFDKSVLNNMDQQSNYSSASYMSYGQQNQIDDLAKKYEEMGQQARFMFDTDYPAIGQLFNGKLSQSLIKYKIHEDLNRNVNSLDDIHKNLANFRTKDFQMFNYNNICPLAISDNFRGRKSVSIINRNPQDVKICKNLDKMCCTPDTLEMFKSDFESGKGLSGYLITKKNDFNIFLLKSFYKYKPESSEPAYFYRHYSKDKYGLRPKACSGKVNYAKCSEYYKTILKSIEHALTNNYWHDYQTNLQKCNSTLEDIRLGIRCASCDDANNKWIDVKDKTIMINADLVNAVIKDCYNADLYEVDILREVYLAYLNYARQIRPNIELDHSILYEAFSNKLTPCSEWIDFSNANKTKDLNVGRECQKYALEKMSLQLNDPLQVRMNRGLYTYMKNIMRTLLHSDHMEEMITYFTPDKVIPPGDFDEEYIRYKQLKEKGVIKEWKFIISAADNDGISSKQLLTEDREDTNVSFFISKKLEKY